MGRLGDILPPQLLLDGGTGTSLIARGLALGDDVPEAWNLEHPKRVRKVHASFYGAGAGAVHTNTFGANRLRLREHGREERIRDYNLAGVHLAREECPPSGLVIGSMGPTGALPPPEGAADLIELEDTYAEQAMYLAEAGVDLLHVETLYHPKEARAALRGIRYGAPELPVVSSLAARANPSGYATHIGFAAENLVQVFVEERADGVGVNCAMPPTEMIPLIEALASTLNVPIFAQPTVAPDNTGPLYPAEFATGVAKLFAAGARAVGGCCGTSAADIEHAAAEITERPPRPPTHDRF